MLRKSMANAEAERIDLTPMMDVVFIMLIFFIVTTTFVKEDGIAISRPSIQPTHSQADTTTVIKLAVDGYFINNQVVNLNGIESRLTQLKASQPSLNVQLLSDKRTDVATLIQAVDQIKQAKVDHFAVTAY